MRLFAKCTAAKPTAAFYRTVAEQPCKFKKDFMKCSEKVLVKSLKDDEALLVLVLESQRQLAIISCHRPLLAGHLAQPLINYIGRKDEFSFSKIFSLWNNVTNEEISAKTGSNARKRWHPRLFLTANLSRIVALNSSGSPEMTVVVNKQAASTSTGS